MDNYQITSYRSLRIQSLKLCHLIFQTAFALCFLMYNLAKNPEKQEKLREEIASIVRPGKELFHSEVNNSSYLRSCIKESFRLTFDSLFKLFRGIDFCCCYFGNFTTFRLLFIIILILLIHFNVVQKLNEIGHDYNYRLRL